MTQASPDAEQGSAVIEVVLLGITLLLPLLYAMLTVFEVQRASYAATTAVREAGRAFVTAPTEVEGRRRAAVAASLAAADQGLPPGSVPVSIGCRARCLTPGGRVDLSSTIAVPLPLLPRIFGDELASVTVTAEHRASVDRFRAAR
jgi:hypothetical protein